MKNFLKSARWISLLFLIVLGCAVPTPSPIPTPTPTPTPKPIHDTVIVNVIVHDTTTIHDTSTITINDTVTIVKSVVLYKDTAGDATYVPLSSTADNSLLLQAAFDQPGTRIKLPEGHFLFHSPVLLQRFNGSYYAPVTKIIEGIGTYSSADGSGTILDFSQCTSCAFGIGLQGNKGTVISGITMIGRWVDNGSSGYNFYNFPNTNGVCRNSWSSPESAIVIDPFGWKVPSDGGYQGTDAYGNPWSTYYRGSNNGSTGIDIHDIKFQHWLVGIITSPNGVTGNAELLHWYKQNMQWVRFPYIGCQSQEKQNVIGPEIECWGPTEIFFQMGVGYGAGSPGNYHIHDVNLAGAVQKFAYISESGYFSNNIDHIFAESLGSLGTLSSGNGSSFSESSINFANYIDETMSYTFGQIQGEGFKYSNCQFRMYGTYTPITIYNRNGYNAFDNCGFDVVPYYNTNYPVGQMSFTNCKIGGIQATNPSGYLVPIDSTAPGFAPVYTINDTLVGLHYQATIQCVGNEMSRVKVGSILVAFDMRGISAGVAGVVTAIGTNSFTLNYIPTQIVSGAKYGLNLWLQKLGNTAMVKNRKSLKHKKI